MAERFYPDEFVKKALPRSFFKQDLIKKDFSLKKTAIRALNTSRALSGRGVQATIYKTIGFYEDKFSSLTEAGLSAKDAFTAAINDEALLMRRLEHVVVFDEVQRQKEEHAGEFYRWLPSGAANPDPEHQLLYGKIFRVGEGDKEGNMPCERYGCQCGIEWLGNPAKEKILDNTDKRFIGKAEGLYEKAKAGSGFANAEPIVYRRIVSGEAEAIKRATGLDLRGYEHKLTGTDLRHIFLQHGNFEREAARGQLPVRAKDIALIPEITRKYDSLTLSPKRAKDGKRVLIYKKKIGTEYYYLEGIGGSKKEGVTPKTMYIKKK